jgi:hypothetical protein
MRRELGCYLLCMLDTAVEKEFKGRGGEHCLVYALLPISPPRSVLKTTPEHCT